MFSSIQSGSNINKYSEIEFCKIKCIGTGRMEGVLFVREHAEGFWSSINIQFLDLGKVKQVFML